MVSRFIFISFIAIVLAACTPQRFVTQKKSEDFEPVAKQSWDYQIYSYPANKPAWDFTCPPDTSGLGPYSSAQGFLAVGYEHSYDSGAVIFSCSRQRNDTYRAAFKFDLSSLQKLKPHIYIERAVLILYRHNLKGDHECIDTLMAATEDWNPAPSADKSIVPALFPQGNDDYFDKSTVWTCQGYANCGMQMDVTNIVNAWTLGMTPNYGFVIKGEGEQNVSAKDNANCLTEYGNFMLGVTYTYDIPQ